MRLCKTHITALKKVARQLELEQTMNYTQLILGENNKNRIGRALTLLYIIMNTLEEVK
jgi:hypothetical protein